MDNRNNRFSKPVAFNALKESALVDYVNKKKNFSGYVKKLIIADMQAKGIETKAKKTVEGAKETASDRLSRLHQQIKKPSE